MQVPDFSHTGSSQEVIQAPSSYHAISVSKSTQVPIFSDPSSLTVCIEELPSFPTVISSSERMQNADFSATSSNQEVLQVLSISHSVSASKSTQAAASSDPRSSMIVVEIMSSPGPLSKRESIEVSDFSDTGSPDGPIQDSLNYATTAKKSTQVLKLSDSSSSTLCPEELPSIPLIVLSTESAKVPDISATSSSRDAMGIPSTIQTLSSSKSTQVPIFSDPSTSTTCIEELSSLPDLVTSKESTQVPDCSAKSSSEDVIQVPSRIHALSVSKSTTIPGVSQLPSPTTSTEEVVSFPAPFSYREPMQVPDLYDKRLPQEPMQTPPANLAMEVSKSSQVSTVSDPSTSTSSTRESLQVPLLSTLTSSKETKEGQQSPGLQSPVEFAKDDGTRSAQPSPAASPRLLSKTFTYPYCSGPSISQHFMEVPDFSVPTSHKESTQAPALSSPNSIRESFEFPTISKSSSTRESFAVPSLHTSSSSRISAHVPTSSGLKSPTEYGESECAHSPNPSSPRGSAQPSPITSPRLLKKPTLSLFSGPGVLKQVTDDPSSFMSSSQRQSIQDSALSSSNSLKESIDVVPASTFSLSRGATEVFPSSVVKSSMEFKETETVYSSPSFPRERAQPSPSTSPRLSSKSLPLPPFSETGISKQSMEMSPSTSRSRRESIQGPAFFVPNFMSGSLDFPIISRLISVRESLDIPPLSTSISFKGSVDRLSSSGLKSPTDYSESETAHSPRSSSPKEPIQVSPTTSPNLVSISMQFPLSGLSSLREPSAVSLTSPSTVLRPAIEYSENEIVHSASPSSPKESKKPPPSFSPNLISKYTQITPISESNVAKESIEFPDFSDSSSQRKSIQGPAFFDSNSMTEPFEFPILSGATSTRQSLDVPFFSPSSSLRGSTEVFPSSGLRSPTEYAEGERAHSPRPGSPKESRQPSHLSSPNLGSRSMQFPSSLGPSISKQSMEVHVSSMLRSQRESIQDTASSAPNSLRDSSEFPILSDPGSTREPLEVLPCYSRPNSTKESLPVIPISDLTSVKEPEEDKISAAVSQHSVSDVMEALALMGLSFKTEFMQVHPPLILSHPQEFPEDLHVPSRGSQRQFIQVPTSPSQSSLKEYMNLSPSIISQRESIHNFASSSSLRKSTSISSQRESDHVSDLSSSSSQTESMGLPPSTISSQRESTQVLFSYSESSQKVSKDHPSSTISSARESIQVTDSFSLASNREAVGFPLSSSSSQKEAIQIPASCGPSSQEELTEVLPSSSPISQRESMEVFTSFGLGPSEDSMQSPLSSARSSLKDFIDVIPLSGPDSSEEFVGTPLSLGQSYPQDFIDDVPLSGPVSSEEFTDVPASPSPSTTKDFTEIIHFSKGGGAVQDGRNPSKAAASPTSAHRGGILRPKVVDRASTNTRTPPSQASIWAGEPEDSSSENRHEQQCSPSAQSPSASAQLWEAQHREAKLQADRRRPAAKHLYARPRRVGAEYSSARPGRAGAEYSSARPGKVTMILTIGAEAQSLEQDRKGQEEELSRCVYAVKCTTHVAAAIPAVSPCLVRSLRCIKTSLALTLPASSRDCTEPAHQSYTVGLGSIH
ncbi:mucin-5AC-like [Vombatus ursinus]|uniref:mucin-5AC-like n=1 Tax=Vombatus ursinus TaxID=29139 RepID=UPI000FFCEA52|nr:mucin-5AC-like [Vombatus ursinus]